MHTKLKKKTNIDLLFFLPQKEEKLKQLADKYQTLVSGKMSNYIKNKIETPITMVIHIFSPHTFSFKYDFYIIENSRAAKRHPRRPNTMERS